MEAIDPAVLNAVAPYDHDSSVDRYFLWRDLARDGDRRVHECLREEGFTETPPEPDLPERDDPELMANLDFPDGERLAREGLVLTREGGEHGNGPEWKPPAGWATAEEQCRDELSGEHPDTVTPAQELFTSIGRAWDDELAAVEAEEEIAERTDDFGECLQDEGIPAEAAADEAAFLGYVDGRVMAADDAEAEEEAAQEHGRLYGKCGLPLFEAREHLRAERRADFLNEHRADLQALAELIDGTE